MHELLGEWMGVLERGLPCVYAIVVETRGSTPQKAGAAMLVFPTGGQLGTLGGGCVEAEVKMRSLKALQDASARAQVFTFCLDSDFGWDDGLICGGRMTVIAQPCPAVAADSSPAIAYFGRLRGLVERGDGFTEVIVFAASEGRSIGDRYLFDQAGECIASLAVDPDPERVLQGLQPLGQRPRPGARQGIAYLPKLQRISLLLVGAGHVSQAVARLASEVDFEVWVLDDRDSYASRGRFPAAARLIVGEIGPSLKRLAPELTDCIYALVLTRGHKHDEEALYYLAESACGYVGMIGSSRKIRLIFDDLAGQGIARESLKRVDAPLGLPIGSRTVPEIAVSIVAKLIACRNGQAAGRDVVARQP